MSSFSRSKFWWFSFVQSIYTDFQRIDFFILEPLCRLMNNEVNVILWRNGLMNKKKTRKKCVWINFNHEHLRYAREQQRTREGGLAILRQTPPLFEPYGKRLGVVLFKISHPKVDDTTFRRNDSCFNKFSFNISTQASGIPPITRMLRLPI